MGDPELAGRHRHPRPAPHQSLEADPELPHVWYPTEEAGKETMITAGQRKRGDGRVAEVSERSERAERSDRCAPKARTKWPLGSRSRTQKPLKGFLCWSNPLHV